jgi:hypothetical protein
MSKCYIFEPCKGDNSFKLVPRSKVDRKKMTKNILEGLKGKLVANTSFLIIIETKDCKITINKRGEIIVRGIEKPFIEEFSTKLMKLL